MPLVKIFARVGMNKAIPLSALQSKMCAIWGTKPETTKLILSRVEGTYLHIVLIHHASHCIT